MMYTWWYIMYMIYNPFYFTCDQHFLHRKDVIHKQLRLTGKASCKRAAWHLQTHDANRNDLKLERFGLEPQRCCNICNHVAPFLCQCGLGFNTYPTKHGECPSPLTPKTVSPEPWIEHKSASNPWILKMDFFVWHMCFPDRLRTQGLPSEQPWPRLKTWKTHAG